MIILLSLAVGVGYLFGEWLVTKRYEREKQQLQAQSKHWQDIVTRRDAAAKEMINWKKE